MARLPRFFSVKRKALLFIAAFIAINMLLVSEYSTPHELGFPLEDAYDPTLPPDVLETSPQNTSNSRILIISALFLVPQLKTSNEAILSFLPRFLGPITTDIYIYTTPELASIVEAARETGSPLTIDTSFTSPFELPPLKGREAVYRQMHDVDRERDIHAPELYAVWNAKPFLVENAIRTLQGIREYDYVFWNDADSFKEGHAYSAWPNAERMEKVWEEGSNISGTRKEDLIFMPILNPPSKGHRFWTEDMGPIDIDFSEGSFFGGSPDAMKWFSRTFYSYHDHFITLGYFSGKDKTIYNSLLVLFPSRFITVWAHDPSASAHNPLPMFVDHGYLGACGNEQYYYQWWLSDRDTRDKMRHRWMANDHDQYAVSWWKKKFPCRSTRVLGVEGVLRREFGDRWAIPSGTISTPSRTW